MSRIVSYPVSLMVEVRQLAEIHTVRGVRRVLSERGVDPLPSHSTLCRWLGHGSSGLQWSGVRDPQRRAELARGSDRALLPLGDEEALERARLLRCRGLSYPDLSVVMGVYHGQWATDDAWRGRLRVAGVAPSRAGGWRAAA